MAKEKITKDQQQKQEDATKNCKKSIQQRSSEISDSVSKETEESIDEVKQKAAKQWSDLKKGFNETVDAFSGAITNWKNPFSDNVDASSIIEPIKAIIQPITELLKECDIEIPYISEINSVIDTAEKTEEKVKSLSGSTKSALQEQDKSTSDGIFAAGVTISISFSMLFINLIIQAIMKIISLILELIETLTFDNLPYPLNVIPKLATALPKLLSLATNLPSALVGMYQSIASTMNTAANEQACKKTVSKVKNAEILQPCSKKQQQLANTLANTTLDIIKQKI